MMAEQRETTGLAKGGQPYQSTGVSNTPVEPTLASQGIDKNLAKRARLRKRVLRRSTRKTHQSQSLALYAG
jgi:hypothetical protein